MNEIKKLILRIIIIIFNPVFFNLLTLKFCKANVDSETLIALDECADQNTRFLKNKVSQKTIMDFKNYCYKEFKNSDLLSLALFHFTPDPNLTDSGFWSIEHINDTKSIRVSRAKKLFAWLQKNYIPKKEFSFFYLTGEPYFDGWQIDTKTHNQLTTLLSQCPLLITCNHPDLPWTKKSILIPDDWMMSAEFQSSLTKLLNADFVPFPQKKSQVYFRGGLTGPKLPFSFENMPNNPRHYLLTLIEQYNYLSLGVTDFKTWRYNPQSPYLEYLLKNFSYLKCEPVDFFEHAKHKYLLSCDGYGAAWSRVELIMATGSVLFLNAQCEQYFYALMENNKTHIQINKDFSNLDAEFKRLENKPKIAEKIGLQGKEFAQKFFTQKAIDTYLWLVLNKLEKNNVA